jgi:hypothetical protein
MTNYFSCLFFIGPSCLWRFISGSPFLFSMDTVCKLKAFYEESIERVNAELETNILISQYSAVYFHCNAVLSIYFLD